ncbi:MAG TPA: recombination mediator RecR [Candidatus Sulfotelmatobacter sp.]|jgi:recombination protein RecR|nr:recombination mediator RecR [Candidatus Sulfotelmatobacter sp.]
MKIPKPIQQVIESFERLPGIGPKSAERLTFYLLHVPQGELDRFAKAVQNIKKDTVICSVCFNIGEADPCSICQDNERNHYLVCVVEQPLDIIALEKSKKYPGVYHVLNGKIDPLNNIGPDEIRVSELIQRVKDPASEIKEVIIATNPTMEGEATAMYIAKKLKEQNINLKVSRIGRGLPVGADIEYADPTTLDRAMEGRSEY